MTIGVDLDPVDAARRGVLENLFQLYVHDFSAFLAGQLELDDDGRFPPYPLGDWFDGSPDRSAFFIRADGALAGFALVNRVSHSGLPLDWNVAEFFVVRKHRRSGVGIAAAHLLWGRYPGTWEAAVARRNLPALAFWRGAVASCPCVAEVQELDRDDDLWRGPILRFRIDQAQ